MSDNAEKLSWRVRAGSEAAPWVVEEIIKLEGQRDQLLEALENLTGAVRRNGLTLPFETAEAQKAIAEGMR